MAGQHFKLVSSVFILLFAIGINALDARNFVATQKNARLRRRDASFEPRLHGQTLVYAEYNPYTGNTPPSAIRLSLTPKKPMLILEDVFPLVDGVQCNEDSIDVRFAKRDVFSGAQGSWQTIPDFFLVTAEAGCAPYGEHAVYEVSYAGQDASSNTIILTAAKTTLRNSTHKMYVDMGHHIVPDVDSTLFRRDAQAQQATTTTPPAIQTSSHYLATSISIAPPTATAETNIANENITFSRTNTTLFPPDNEIVAFVPQLEAIAGLSLICLNCSMTGQLSLQVAGFEMDSNDVEQAFEFFNDGFFEFSADGVGANMEFAVDVAPGFSLLNTRVPFSPQLPAIPLLPLSVPGVLNFGPILELHFPFAITLNSDVRFTTGFTLDVPQNATLILNVSHPLNSSSNGFQDSKLTMLPFDLNVDNLSLNISAGFQPRLLLAAGLGGDSLPIDIGGAIGTFLNLPTLNAEVSLVNNVTENCRDPAPSNEKNTRVHIEPSVGISGGVTWQLSATIAGEGFERQVDTPLFTVTKALPDQCLLFDSEKGGVATTNTTSGSASPSPSPKGAATTLRGSQSMASLMFAFVGLILLI